MSEKLLQKNPHRSYLLASRVTEGEVPEGNFEEIDETFVTEEPVIIPVMEEEAPSASSRKSSVKREDSIPSCSYEKEWHWRFSESCLRYG